MKSLRSLHALFLVLPVAALSAAACGGGTDTATTEPPDPAATASGGPGAPSSPPSSSPSSAPDAAAPDAAPPNPYAGGAPISVTPGAWTYVPMSDVVCGNGTTSGVGVNFSTTPGAPLLVFMMGGGACWDALTCLGGTAANVADAVGEAEILADIPRVHALFDRTAQDNPFRDASFVFVPYCTGDIHAGDAEKTYTLVLKTQKIQHRGARNTDAVLRRLLATFPAPPKVWLTGASGGGYGAMLNFHRFRAAWPSVRIDVLDDCGPPVHPTGSIWKDMQASWKAELPPGCAGCDADVSKLLPYLAGAMGEGRFALLGYTRDKTIRAFSGKLLAQDLEDDLLALRDAAGPRQRMFYVAGDSHVLLKQDPLPVAPSGTALSTWLQRFASDDPAWSHEGP